MQRDASWSAPDDPERWMAGYRVVVFDPEGPGSRITPIEAQEDGEALACAREIAGALAFELWDALCLLARQEPAG